VGTDRIARVRPPASGPAIDLALEGPSEEAWSNALSAIGHVTWPSHDRLVVVSPHPDDETLGAGGAMASEARHHPVLVISVTDGEAASVDDDLGGIRRRELRAALDQLAPRSTIAIQRLAISDGAVADVEDMLQARLARLFSDGDLVLCPVSDDGHPDHEAVARATTWAASERDLRVWQFPVWAWHAHDPSSSSLRRGRRFDLDPSARRNKQRAIACYRSQIGGDEPVVPPRMLTRLDRPFELFVPR
jgi:LmbE family N-acetylglucosaminyl deacetylase